MLGLKTASAIALLALSSAVVAAPVDAIAQGSKHTLYLMSCTRTGLLDCPLLILCDKNSASSPNDAAVSRFTAVAYYANGPPTSSFRNSPTSLTVVAQGDEPWEGTTRAATISRQQFSSSIDAAAGDLDNGQIAGSAKLGTEDFVCFTDGTLRITGSENLGLTQWSCTAGYYCPSVAV